MECESGPADLLGHKETVEERIIIAIDVSKSMNSKHYKTRAGVTFSALEITKKALKLFIANKDEISNRKGKHKFALVFLLDEALWVKDFTSNVQDLFTHINGIQTLDIKAEQFDMTSFYNLLIDKAQPCTEVPPNYLVRCLFIYGRSDCLPVYSNRDSQCLLEACDNFFLDVVYLHEVPNEKNKAQEIYSELCELEDEDRSHVFEVAKVPTKIFDVFGRLLSHPYVRPKQTEPVYKLEPDFQTLQEVPASATSALS